MNKIRKKKSNNNLISVNGYYKKNGTFVKPHVRTLPNDTKDDNLSSKK